MLEHDDQNTTTPADDRRLANDGAFVDEQTCKQCRFRFPQDRPAVLPLAQTQQRIIGNQPQTHAALLVTMCNNPRSKNFQSVGGLARSCSEFKLHVDADQEPITTGAEDLEN